MLSTSEDSKTPIFYKEHTIRTFSSWKSIIEEAEKWVNTNIHVARVASISMVYCHATGAGKATIYYNAAKDDILQSKIKQLCEYGLSHAMMDTYNNWGKQQEKTLVSMNKINQVGGKIINVCEL